MFMRKKPSKQKRLAVLIDADNAQPSIIEGLLDEIASLGVASVKRLYGDFTMTKLSGWKKVLHEYGINPVQQFAYTTGKNATDAMMIIDAMDLLYTGDFDGFCLVSSDSDFTRLASRLRESGLIVYGFGEQKTPRSFVSACDKFVYTENLRTLTVVHKTKLNTKELHSLILDAIEDTADLSGWARMGTLLQKIVNKYPDFDPRSYGHKNLSALIEKQSGLEIRYEDPISKEKSVEVRIKRKRSYN